MRESREETSMSFEENVVSGNDLANMKTQRMKTHVYKSIVPALVNSYEDQGWAIDRKFVKVVRMKKEKPIDIAFEDEIWVTLANLGFSILNKNRYFKAPYSSDPVLTQQIDVFAADEESVLFVECKATNGEPKKGNFKEVIEAIGGKKEGIIAEIRKIFPEKKLKVKFVLATKNYYLSQPDIERLTNFDIAHFDEENIIYYQELSKHLGHSARFQLLGYLFAGQKIAGIENRVPAIEGRMGGHTYYSFSIEPDKLLKIGYVLHRSKANRKLMPTYQRLIKNTRLISIRKFIDNGGFFPNSIIISIDTNGRNLQFDLSNTQVESAISKIGILHLPQKYRSAYIIDGQHRLYGYADSVYATSNSIPVVAFTNLQREDQVRLFMEINENQKAVSKNLRNTLNSDLLWDSKRPDERIKALKLQLAMDLGEEKSSPLYDRVIVGENPKTTLRCIYIDTIRIGFDRSNFFGQYTSTSLTKDGTFDLANNDATFEKFFPFIQDCFTYIKENLPDEWAKGEAENGFLAINAGIESLIRIFSDIIDQLIRDKIVAPKSDKNEVIIEEMKYYLDPLIEYLLALNEEQKIAFKRSYGSGQRTRYWRTLQKAIADARAEFNPDGLDKYLSDNEKKYNEESFKIIRDIETSMKIDFKKKLQEKHGVNWFKLGIPKAVYDAATKLASDKNYEAKTKEEEVEPWDCLTLINYRAIAIYASNWRDLFEKAYTKPGDESGNKESKTEWIQKLGSIRNNNFHSYSVKEEEYEFLKELKEWLLP